MWVITIGATFYLFIYLLHFIFAFSLLTFFCRLYRRQLLYCCAPRIAPLIVGNIRSNSFDNWINCCCRCCCWCVQWCKCKLNSFPTLCDQFARQTWETYVCIWSENAILIGSLLGPSTRIRTFSKPYIFNPDLCGRALKNHSVELAVLKRWRFNERIHQRAFATTTATPTRTVKRQ